MDDLIYVSMTGASQFLTAQSAHANNLANASTTGFRADLMGYRAMPVFGEGEASRVYALAEKAGTDFRPGPRLTTGRELDVAVAGEGWLAVQAADGSEAYTRAGDLRVDPNGQLITGAGHPVLGEGGPIAIPPAEKIEIGIDGTISIRPVGQEATALAVVDRLKLVNPRAAELHKGEDGLIHLASGTAAADAAVQLTPGALEGSNVNSVDALVGMIELSRQYELSVKLMKIAEDNAAATDTLMSVT